jgi:hypothetical protein
MSLRFLHSAVQNLLQWIGLIQNDNIITLTNPGSLSNSSLRNLTAFSMPSNPPISLPLSYTFRLKTSHETYSNVFCLLDHIFIHLPNLDPTLPSSLCIISEFYHSTAYTDILQSLRSLFLRGLTSVEYFINQLCSSPTSIPIPLPPYPKDPFSSFSASQISRLLIGLLTDTSIIILGSDPGQVSTFCYSLISFIFPLQWEHLFAPMLPSRAVKAVESPSPFLVGVHSSLLPTLGSLDIEKHFLVNLDDRTVFGVAEVIPKWAERMIGKLRNGNVSDLLAFVPVFLCEALGVLMATNPKITMRRLMRTVGKRGRDELSERVRESHAVCMFLRELEKKKENGKVMRFFERVKGEKVTSSAIQTLEDFPVIRRRKR